ncbi:DUF2798 domain-containing protein [Oceanobacillus sojae]|uniref:DUF2798 domain-containing protein n=1 Tax=Oceanobacillus sojae TaxID=582851 RepID=UPI0011BFC5A0|nr:DUF2798 domain-containing protein [Oceanobacillus sojae]
MKINKKYEHITFTVLMGLGISCIISFVLVSINIGYNSSFLGSWLTMWLQAFICAVPCAYYFPKAIRKLMKIFNFVEKETSYK